MLLSDDGRRSAPLRAGCRDTFAFTAQTGLLAALGRTTYAFMCLRWEGVWLYGAVTGEPADATRRLAAVGSPVLALRLQTAASDTFARGRLRDELLEWATGFAACADLHDDVLRAHPGFDALWSLPTDTPERLQLADRAEDLLGHAHRFEQLALDGAALRRTLPAVRAA